MGSDEELGKGEVDLRGLRHESEADVWVPLERGTAGKVHMRIVFRFRVAM